MRFLYFVFRSSRTAGYAFRRNIDSVVRLGLYFADGADRFAHPVAVAAIALLLRRIQTGGVPATIRRWTTATVGRRV